MDDKNSTRSTVFDACGVWSLLFLVSWPSSSLICRTRKYSSVVKPLHSVCEALSSNTWEHQTEPRKQITSMWSSVYKGSLDPRWIVGSWEVVCKLTLPSLELPLMSLHRTDCCPLKTWDSGTELRCVLENFLLLSLSVPFADVQADVFWYLCGLLICRRNLVLFVVGFFCLFVLR